ncbi:MAG: leucine--tRNA ligase, partial [DPANN group archaeon]|nr:leucine--tRNA ligase [DPANN group archaeon]
CLEMFPYPSASFLHMGHVRNYTIGDVYARFKRMNGFNVLYPMGYDSFGLPAENAAKKQGINPKIYTENAIAKITEYLKKLGNSYDWSRRIATHEPEYYKWNQYFFLKFYDKGLVYRKKAPVNWCPKCNTVLANEEVESGKCWRCNTEVIQKELEQWFMKTTAYTDELLADLDELKWSERLKTLQKNWIGKSEGILIDFPIKGSKEKLQVFTTRPDTIYGVTFVTISPKHKHIDILATKNKKEIEALAKKVQSEEEKDKEGVFTGSYVINPLTKEDVPVYAANFVVAEYGTGAVMAVPAHDQRDFEFAKKYKIPVKVVIEPKGEKLDAKNMKSAFTEKGFLVNSKQFDKLYSIDAIREISDYIEKNRLGKKTTQYRLRDWLISRQRYWGTPIPIIYCKRCGVVPLKEKDLPLLLPKNPNFKVTGNPLATATDWIETKCPKCKGPARRETDTMGGFMDSSWYFLRYCDPKNSKLPFDQKKTNYWMPVDQYIGGKEHAVGHLIYARFFVKALRDLGMLKLDEPFNALLNQGIVYKDGKRMSKSLGNVITQDEIAAKYGIDSARFFLMFVASPEKDMECNLEGVEGCFRNINRIITLTEKKTAKTDDAGVLHKLNKAIKEVTSMIENFQYNLALIKLNELVEYVEKKEIISKDTVEKIILMFSPFTPHICEELWEKIGNKPFASIVKWPIADEKLICDYIEKIEQEKEKTIRDVRNILRIVNKPQPKAIYLYVIPPELKKLADLAPILEKEFNAKVQVFAVNDSKRYDPEQKAGKAKPGKPGIYVE